MVVKIIDDEAIASGLLGYQKCEQCKAWIETSNLCYCEDCDVLVCIWCVYKAHLSSSTRTAHTLYWKWNLVLVDPVDLVKCANLKCRDFKFRHEQGQGNCQICERCTAPHMPKEESDAMRCNKFRDERILTDEEKFWQSFDYSCNVKSSADVQQVYTTKEILKFVLMVRHWGWTEAKMQRILQKAMDDGKIVEVPESLYHRARRNAKVLVNTQQ